MVNAIHATDSLAQQDHWPSKIIGPAKSIAQQDQ
jgi:hypothetical protein